MPDGFPRALTDDGLAGAIDRLSRVPLNWPDVILPELTLHLIGIGQEEEARRRTSELLSITHEAARVAEESSKSALLVAKVALGVSVLTLIVALVALFAS